MSSKTAASAALTNAQAELVSQNLVLVNHLVKSALGKVPAHVDKDELTSAGLYALVTCARDFDESRGVPFSGYAATRVKGAILDEMRSRDWASRGVRRRARELDAIRSQLAVALGRPATEVEVAHASGYSVTEIHDNDADVARAAVGSLDAHTPDQLDQVLGSRPDNPEDDVLFSERLHYLRVAVAELPERLRRVVEGYFFADLPMADLAEELEVSESRISQMRAEAVQLLRDALAASLELHLPASTARMGAVAARRRDAYVTAVAATASAANPMVRQAAARYA